MILPAAVLIAWFDPSNLDPAQGFAVLAELR
jgi:hypothetical protein